MPSYKTHSIHAELLHDELESYVEINKEDLKTFAMGPDVLIGSDFDTFKRMHKENVKEYFESLLKSYKENRLLENTEAMAFLYGQLDHYMLDVITHPFIYYLTENEVKLHSINPHGLVEMWIDDYCMNKYDKYSKFYYSKFGIKSDKLKQTINDVTNKVYGSKNVSNSYNKGIYFLSIYDSLIRNNLIGIIPIVTTIANTGDFTFKNDLSRVITYLNLDNDIWLNPETGKQSNYSFNDLFDKSLAEVTELINDVNNYLYRDMPLNNYYIQNNISYNTGLNCDLGQTYKYAKDYTISQTIIEKIENAEDSISESIKRPRKPMSRK